jgi:lycopene beta-cyclase
VNNNYNYIIAGAGCAGLSLVMRMISSGRFSDKKILLIDKAEKNSNDRTWCFWEKDKGFFEPIVFMRWHKLWFHGQDYSDLKQIAPFEYKMIRGIDFYDYCFGVIRKQKNITLLNADIEKMESNNQETFVVAAGKKITADYIFNSIIFEKPILEKKQFYLLQHFKGWVIEADEKCFDAEEATLMDFRVSQHRGTSFVYVMPFSASKALVEYTLFTEKLLHQEEYNTELKNYLSQFLGLYKYRIAEEESGAIPMTNYQFPPTNNKLINIGNAAGMTKASSGYTFQFIQKQSTEMLNALLKTGKPFLTQGSGRFHFYDSVLLNVLATGKVSGDKIFTDLFRKNRIADIFNFLDNESSFTQDFRIIKTLPTAPFLCAAYQQLF